MQLTSCPPGNGFLPTASSWHPRVPTRPCSSSLDSEEISQRSAGSAKSPSRGTFSGWAGKPEAMVSAASMILSKADESGRKVPSCISRKHARILAYKLVYASRLYVSTERSPGLMWWPRVLLSDMLNLMEVDLAAMVKSPVFREWVPRFRMSTFGNGSIKGLTSSTKSWRYPPASELDIGVSDHLPVLHEKEGRKGSGSLPSSATLASNHFSAQRRPLTPVPMATYGSSRVWASFVSDVFDPSASPVTRAMSFTFSSLKLWSLKASDHRLAAWKHHKSWPRMQICTASSCLSNSFSSSATTKQGTGSRCLRGALRRNCWCANPVTRGDNTRPRSAHVKTATESRNLKASMKLDAAVAPAFSFSKCPR